MDVVVLAVGKTTKGAEADLCARYADRVKKLGRTMGVTDLVLKSVAEATGPTRIDVEGERLLAALPQGFVIALDERGRQWTSAELARGLQGWVDTATPSVTFLIGGADGLSDAVKARANMTLALSALTVPHMLAKVIVLEQIYRAITINVGHPYHRI
ncbi:MAG: 23S rRNA (pseudouridine(1915)-N(3))-methyltransferase RlmH [Devosia sp.]